MVADRPSPPVVEDDSLRRLKMALVAPLALAGMLVPTTAAAYSPAAAVAWADQWWNGRSPDYDSMGNDCANFVSQSLHEGGYNYRNKPSKTATSWWSLASGSLGIVVYDWTLSFVRVNDLQYFVLHDSPGGEKYKNSPGDTLAGDSGGRLGDVLFYDWDWDGVYSHTAIVTVNAPDKVNAHTSNRYHVFWTLQAFNPDFRTTRVESVRIDAGN